MKRTLEKKLLSIALTLIMIFVSYVAMPAKALAEEAKEAEQTEAIEAYADANDFSQDNSLAYSPLVGELREERDESVKVFRRADGAQEAVIYSDPIHYLNGEAWETIDNTLELVTLEDGTQAYRNKANDFIVSFSPYFNADNLITVESKGHILSWRFTEDVPFAQEESAEEAETPEAEVPEEPEQEEEQPTEEPEEVEAAEEPAEEPDDQETLSNEPETDDALEESETPIEEEGTDEEIETEESIETEPEAAETDESEPVAEEYEYETLKITDAKAEITERERKEPETDEERDMLLRYPEELTSELTYKDPETGLNVHYVLSGKRLSEQIVLDHAPETVVAYTTLLTTNGLKAEEKDGRIKFVDDNGEAIFEILPPVMYDANGEECTDIEVQLIETEEGYAYTLIPDEKWLQDKSRTYPVIVDPDIRPSFSGSATDTFITASSPNTDYSAMDRLRIGGTDACDALVYFDITSIANALETGDVVLEATVNLSRYASTLSGEYVKAYPIVKDWITPQAYSWNAFSALGSPVNTDRAIALVGAAVGSNFNHIDVTDLTKKWIAGVQPNYGIYLDASGFVEYHSAEYNPNYSGHPYFSLIYVNSTGLEDRYTYYSQSTGRAGTGSVNLFSGNLTWTHADASIANGVLPISLSHVYNTNDESEDIGYGFGWRLNYAQSLEKVLLPNRTETAIYYQWIDGDGTRHYYREGPNNTYVNELDQNSELTFGDTTATIEDKGGNKLIFAYDSTLEKGRLTTIEDVNGNQILITYTTSTITDLRISAVQEQLSGQAAGQQLTLSYTNNHLSGVTSPDGLNVSYAYTSNDLTGISYADSNACSYTYSGHCLTQATNIDNYSMHYTYGDDMHRVTNVQEFAGVTPGESLIFTYEWNSTVVQDAQERNTIYQFDNNGQAVSVRDVEGRAMYAAYNTADRTVTQLSAVSKLQSTTINLLKNGHFARSADWTLGTGASYYGWYGFNGLRTMRLNASAEISQTVSVENGKAYTLSAAVCGGAGVYLQIIPTSGSIITLDPASEGIAQGDGWEKLSLGMKATYTGAVTVKVVNGGSAQAWVDYVQFEQSETPGRYNLVENSDWRNGTNQYYFNGNCNSSPSGLVDITNTAVDATHPEVLDNHVYKIVGSSYNNYLYYSTQCYGKEGDTWTFGGWCYTEAPARTSQRIHDTSPYSQSYCNLYIRVRFFTSSHKEVGTSAVAFKTDLSQWQYVCGSAVAPEAYSYVTVNGEFSFACNDTYFDGFQLYREEFSQAYSYDTKGNLTGHTSLIGQQNSFAYDSENNLTSSTDARGNTTTYDYDSNHNLTEAKTPTGVKSTNTINGKGQTTKTVVSHTQFSRTIETTAAYDNNTGLTSSVTDARGNTVQYGYDTATRATTTITDPLNHTATYLYGDAAAMHRLASITSSGLGVVEYGYDPYGKLETITRGDTVYTLEYDSTWSLPVKTKVGSVALSTNTYDSHKRLSTVTYANGLSARYEYDNLDRVQKIYQTENNSEELIYEMIYNGEGDLYEIRNYRTNRASFFDYDHAGRCMASRERSFTEDNGTITYGTILSSYGYRYDECNNLTKLTCSVAGVKWNTVYTYDNDNRPSTTTLSSGKVITNGFDKLGRLHTRTIGLSSDYVIEIDYVDVGNSKTTGLVETYRNGSDAEYEYEYDAVGNITSITQDGTSITYEYDAANRLTRENNGVLNQTIVYDYTNDLWGNIQSKTVYPYTTGTLGTPISTVCYAYANTDWGDQLTSYNGSTITYDNMGNPTSYRGYTFGWRGKQLVSASNGTNSLTFEYNEDGLRQKKICNNISTDYYYNGSVLIGMQRGQTKYLFSYDAGGNVVSVKQGNNEYYYLRNAQGDIVKLIDATGTSVVEYTYDTWGKKVTTTGSLAGTLGLFQPFRYRGYVYDWETGFYYLQSRYYDPTVGRFISADVLLSTGQGVLGHNAYAYCLGNPGNKGDQSGCCPYYIPGCIICEARRFFARKAAAIGLVVGTIYLCNLEAERNAYNNVNIDENDAGIQKWKGVLESIGVTVNGENNISIDITNYADELDSAIKDIGMVNVCYIIACSATSKYKSETGSDFALLEKTVAFEIQYHVEGYLYAVGKAGYGLSRDLTTCVYSKDGLKDHCHIIDIDYNDVYAPRNTKKHLQSILFDYIGGSRN